jgi:hypothetical protein
MILGKLRALLRHHGYKVFTRPYELNIVGLRADSTIPNRFDDEIHVFYKVSTTNWNYHVFNATTDPGTFWLLHPMNVNGTGLLEKGQYIDAYELGLHKGEYEALVQRKPVTVLREYDRKAQLDFNNGKRETGFFGIDIHRAYAHGTTKTVDKYSAGCQVFENAEAFYQFIELCKRHAKLYGNKFTYSLIDFRAVKRETIRRWTIGLGTAGGTIAVGLLALFGKEKIKSIADEIGEAFHLIFNSQKHEPETDHSPIA